MKITRASAEEWASKRGYKPVQIDGIPEGFSFRTPDVTIGNSTHFGRFIALVPLAEWDGEDVKCEATTEHHLLELFNKASQIWQTRK